jgi:hypothetical protein
MHLLAQSEIRRIDENKLKLWLVISESRPQSVFKIGGISKRTPVRAMASRPSAIEQNPRRHVAFLLSPVRA